MSASLARVSRCFTDPSQNGMWGDYMQNPFISIPQDISNVDPAWAPATCTAGFLGAMDPPRAIKPAVSMVPVGGPAAAIPESQSIPISAATAVPGQPISAPVVAPTAAPAPLTGNASPQLGAADPGNNAGSLSDPAKAQAPAPKPPSNNAPAAVPQNQNHPANDPALIRPISDPNTGNNSPAFQFGSGQGSPEPNNMSPAQLSVLHQALQPSPEPAAADPGNVPGSNAPGTNAVGSSNGSGQGPQPNSNPGIPAGGSNNQPADVQLQPISSAIFNNPTSGSSSGQQSPNSGDGDSGGGGSGGEGSGNGGSGNGGLPTYHQANAPQANSNVPQGNNSPQATNSPQGQNAPQVDNTVPQGDNPPQANNSPQGNNAPQINNAPQNFHPGNAGQGVSAAAANQPPLIRAPNGGLIVGSSTIMPGQAATINNHQVSVGSNNVAIDSNTYAFAAPAPSMPSPIPVGGLPIQAASDGGAVIAGSTYARGAQITNAGHVISVGSGNVVVDGTAQALPTAGPAVAPPVMIGGSPMQRASNGAVIIGSSTLVISAQTTMSNHIISVGVANVVVDGTTNALPTPAPTLASSPVVIDGQQMQRAPNGGFVIGSTTLAPGAQTIIAGHTISVGPSNAIMDDSTYELPTTAGAVVLSTSPSGPQRSAITLPNGSVLSAGGVATIFGTIVSIFSNDQGAVIGGSTIGFAPASVFTVGGQNFTAAPTGFAIAGTTLWFDGPAITISGTVISLGPNGLQIGSSTVPLTAASATGLAWIIMSAFDAPNPANTAAAVASVTGVTPFTGLASKVEGEVWFLSISFIISMVVGGLAIFI